MNKKYWDNLADNFDDEVFNVPAMDFRNRIPKFLPSAKTDGLACDFGCGVGRFLSGLSRTHRKVMAVDLSGACVAKARKRFKELENVEYHVWNMAAQKPPFKDKVDFGICVNVVMMPSPASRKAVLKNMARAIKKGGRLVLIVPALESVMFAVNRLTEWNIRDGYGPLHASRLAWKELVGSQGILEDGIVNTGGTPTKHFMKEELQALLDDTGFKAVAFDKVEYPWDTEFVNPPAWLKGQYPWDWIVSACRTGAGL